MPFQPETVAFEAGRIMLNRVNELLAAGKIFAFETTLATRSYMPKIEEAKQGGYKVILLFFWHNNIELAKERVKTRVAEGGHYIEPDVIERRYVKGIYNLFDLYMPVVDQAFIFGNSTAFSKLVVKKLVVLKSKL